MAKNRKLHEKGFCIDEKLDKRLSVSVDKVLAGQNGKNTRVKLTPAAEARQKTGLSQSQFANLLGISKKTLQGWEQGRREPQGPAKVLIKIADTHPEVLWEINKNDTQLA